MMNPMGVNASIACKAINMASKTIFWIFAVELDIKIPPCCCFTIAVNVAQNKFIAKPFVKRQIANGRNAYFSAVFFRYKIRSPSNNSVLSFLISDLQ